MNYVKLKIELQDTDICRTIVVPDSWTMEKLSRGIQNLFGWMDEHLWAFTEKDGAEIALPTEKDVFFEALTERKTVSAKKRKVGDCFPVRGSKLDYEYDFGDGWTCRITRMADPKVGEVACVKTSGGMAIEDIGGSWYLMNFLGLLREYDKNPKSKLCREDWFLDRLDWCGAKDPAVRKSLLDEPTAEDLTLRLRKATGVK